MTKSKPPKSFVWDDVSVHMGTISADDLKDGSGGNGWNRKMMVAAMSGAIAGSSGLRTTHHRSDGRGDGRGEMQSRAAAMEERKAKRRPDRRPFILEIPGSVFFPSRSMPKACSKYSAIIGETFWRLLAYLDSIPSHVPERIEGKHPHLLVTGVPGSGKSFLLAAASAILGAGTPNGCQPVSARYYSMNGDQHRTVLISDCRRWLDSEDPLQYFRMELLAAFRGETQQCGSEDHPGCLVCVEPFSTLDHAKAYIEKLCAWFTRNHPDTWLVFFIDQAEELKGKESSLPYKIIELLVAAKLPVLVFSSTTPTSAFPGADFPFNKVIGARLAVPFRMAQGEFTKLMEHLSTPEDRFWGREMSLWKDVRLWTGGSPGETIRLLGSTATGQSRPILQRITRHVEAVRIRTCTVLHVVLEPRQRNILLISLFAMALRVPLDWSDRFNIKELRDLDPSISGLLQTDCLQSFFHPSDGTIAIRAIPTATSMASHLALSHPTVLGSIAPSWLSLFETVVTAMHGSKQLCSEARRRFARFYMYSKITWRCKPDWRIEGKGHLGEELTIKFRHPRIIMFAGQVPSQYHFTSSDGTANESGLTALLKPDAVLDPFHDGSQSAYGSIVFLPGRTGYHFFDAFIYCPEEKRFYALCTAPIVSSWLKELETRASPAQIQQHRDDGLLTPLILLDSWKECLRKAGFPKISVKCCLVKPSDLLVAFGASIEPATATAMKKEDQSVEALGNQFVKAASLSPDKDDVIDSN